MPRIGNRRIAASQDEIFPLVNFQACFELVSVYSDIDPSPRSVRVLQRASFVLRRSTMTGNGRGTGEARASDVQGRNGPT